LKELGIGEKRWLKRSKSLATAALEHPLSEGKSLKSLRNGCTDTTRTSLELLSQTSDVFPPLKSAVGGVLALWDLVERVKDVEDEARALLQRANETILLVSELSKLKSHSHAPALQETIDKFERAVDEIRRALEPWATQKWISRMVRSKRHGATLTALQKKLDQVYQELTLPTMSVTIQTGETVSRLRQDLAIVSYNSEKCLHGLSFLLF